ncbi:nucleotide-binding alpha-beta plait domain-containing protein [Artemisia annua]|uniref:Nucleotide-binding alpha-beta plait domain-containing protein n=1 Tax=Artemisia annua TaxID=35608 RepID=A0A2U1MPN3_ARTAN|nr:nucleotide-binding alpha-beta plait domain-containing protein [Artemisia annua]
MTDAYLPRRKDKFGRFFAFIRFEGIRNTDAMIKAIMNVRLGQEMLHANVARFKKEVSKENHNLKRGNTNPYWAEHLDRSRGIHVEGRRTFESVKTNPWKMNNPPQLGLSGKGLGEGDGSHKTIVIPNKNFSINSAVGRCSLVGNVKDIIRLCRMDDFLKSEEVKDVTIRYISGMKVLLTFISNGLADEFLSKENIWGGWFSDMCRWNGQQLTFERIVWLKISGVPIQLWDKEVFNLIGASFGQVVHQSEACHNDGNLAFDTVAVLTKVNRRFTESVKLQWKGQAINVWVDETDELWCPDFLKATTNGSESSVHELEDGEIRDNDVGKGPDEGSGEVQGINGDDEMDVNDDRNSEGLNSNNNVPFPCMHGTSSHVNIRRFSRQKVGSLHGDSSQQDLGGSKGQNVELGINNQANDMSNVGPTELTSNLSQSSNLGLGCNSLGGPSARKRARSDNGLNESLLDLNQPPNRHSFSFPNMLTPDRSTQRKPPSARNFGRERRSSRPNSSDQPDFPLFCPTPHQSEEVGTSNNPIGDEIALEAQATVEIGNAVGIQLNNCVSILHDALRDEGEQLLAQ